VPLRRGTLALAAAAGLAVLAGAFALFALDTDIVSRSAPDWTETAWPFPPDPFGRGKAFRCSPAGCGAEIRLYVRPKLGFCDCTTGVADDDDLDRMGDVYLVAAKATPLLSGRSVSVGPMRGRSRAYALVPHHAAGKTAISVAVNDRCDMIIATAVLPRDDAAAFERHVIAFLNSVSVLRWIEVTLGL